ncbi:uncharacterized protein LOC123552538 [Mercenaria mercenaria]|uniref:uncharacterized protein LOC123552538 n=1 Tax=Mercenaria mercenaria TaxID=6596 RepID=UPI00234FAD4B|nr:uncharacterized protein LOC123552538 [Mercenaria mercenaria]
MSKSALNINRDLTDIRDYNSVAGLKADRLKKLCQYYNIDVKLPKKARIVLLCHCLGISTTGHVQQVTNRSDATKYLTDSQRQELAGITPAYMCRLNEWKKDLSSVPDIEESAVKKYLINTEVLSASDARTYKISRPFALQQFVHSVLFNDNNSSETFLLIRAQCNPSQSTNPDEVKVVFVIIDRYLGEPYGGFCTCTVGNSERCGHVGAVLFKLAELQATGVSEGPSCTDVLCKWADPKGCKAEPTVFQDLNIRKSDPPMRRTVDDYGQKVINTAPPSYDDVVELRANLIAATHHIGQYCPAIHILNCDRFKPENTVIPPPNINEQLPNTLRYDGAAIAPAKEVEIKTTPVVMTQLVPKKFDSITDEGYSKASEEVYTKATNMGIDIDQVNNLTKGQAENPE